MSVLFLLILVLFFWKCQVRIHSVNEDYLSRENTTAFRGILAVLVVCYHLAQRTGDRSLFHIFVFFGFLPVSYFFFLSGYGLQKSYAKKQNYRSTILKKRIPSVALPYLFFVAAYWLLSWLEGEPYSLPQVLASLVNGRSIVSFSWYIQFILLIYLAYYFSTAYFPGDHLAVPALNLLFVLGAAYVFKRLEMAAYWYSTCITYPLGILWAIKERAVTAWVKKRYPLLLAVCLAGFSAFFLATMVFSAGRVILWLYWPCCILFVIAMLLVQMKVTFKNRLLLLLGGCSMEIYMLHGFFMKLYRGQNLYLESPLAWCAAVLLSMLLAAYGLNQVFSAVSSKKRDRIQPSKS